MGMGWIHERGKNRIEPRTYVLVGILVLTLIGIRTMDEKGKAYRARAKSSTPGAAPAPAVLARGLKAGGTTETAAGWGRDPFERSFRNVGEEIGRPRRRAGTAPAPGLGLYLQGVMEGPIGRTALINGEICREGDRVGSYEILTIGTRSVVLMQNGSVTTLTLRGEGS